ncbi:hypothetical protein KEM55_001763 [Ascosphaera atra]|nr:hypothetical protein KEM55_001763 [Ascosphaera atra]
MADLADPTTSKTPRKGDKQADKEIAKFEQERKEATNTLATLREELGKSKYIKWDQAKKDPAGVKAECEKVLEYFTIHANILKEVEERGQRLTEILKQTRLMRNTLTTNAFADKPLTEDEEAEEQFDEMVLEHVRNSERRRKQSRQARGNESEATPLRHKCNTTIDILSDSE